MAALDMTDAVFGRLTVLHRAGTGSNGCAVWRCLCECGRTSDVRGGHLRASSRATHQCFVCAQVERATGVERGGHGSYNAAHTRVRRARGSAALHRCADCPSPAVEWSYKHATGYSHDVSDYTPRCKRCHQNYDRKVAA